MSEEQSKNNFVIIGIVAIVAIVSIILLVLAMGGNSRNSQITAEDLRQVTVEPVTAQDLQEISKDSTGAAMMIPIVSGGEEFQGCWRVRFGGVWCVFCENREYWANGHCS